MATSSTLPAATHIVWVDYDDDGLLDLFVAGAPKGCQLFHTGADGSMEEVTKQVGIYSGRAPAEVTWVDFDADGRADLHEVHQDGSMRLMRNREDGRFEDVARIVGFDPGMPVASSLWLDYDRNGLLDCQVVGQDGRLCILRGGKTSFSALQLKCILPAHAGVVTNPTVVGLQGPVASAQQGRQVGGGAPSRIPLSASNAPSSVGTTQLPGGPTMASATVGTGIAQALMDQVSPAAGTITASSVPALGRLFPLSTNFNVDATTGNVGIRTSSPNQTLSVAGGIGFANHNDLDKKLFSPFDGLLEWRTNDGATAHGFGISHQGIARVYLNTNGPSYLLNTDVGIGTASPQARLDVNGVVRALGGIRFGDGTLQTTAASSGGGAGIVIVGVGDFANAPPPTATGQIWVDHINSAPDVDVYLGLVHPVMPGGRNWVMVY